MLGTGPGPLMAVGVWNSRASHAGADSLALHEFGLLLLWAALAKIAKV